ncbi:MAG: 16S rRNA (uracil(1498)-N(3))-methyltransferase [Polyangiaceae bacterium]|jgi:16S rRNA (uracil1498-N3)-methyltransferase|nr:16S rRNA (uracil(1498)-N(3))-methyltransferase [Polyangiaceae bacterium]
MKRLRVPVANLTEGRGELASDEAHYVGRVHRLGAGDCFLAFDPLHAMEADATVLQARRGRVTYQIACLRPAGHVAVRPLWLLLGTCKGERFDLALREATALGVTDIVPTVCARSKLRELQGGRGQRWERMAVQGARQAGRGDLPRVHPPVMYDQALQLAPFERMLRVCLWESATEPLRQWLRDADSLRGAVLVVGPEGGLEAEEVEAARVMGYSIASMGRFVLRTETAVIAALGAWSVAVGETPYTESR